MSKNITDLISVNEKGLKTLDYKDIVDMLTNRYRLLYGFDIEIDPRSADGRYTYDVATIINTGTSAINQLCKNLNPLTATGTFLDTLCSLTNVTRNSATKSIALVRLTNNTEKDITIDLTQNSDLTDNLGNLWEYIGNYESVTIKSNENLNLKYQCSLYGKIAVTSFKWTTTTYNSVNLSIYTLEKGTSEESDAELRDRRSNYSSNGVNTIESMKMALSQIEGVLNVKIQSYASNIDEIPICYVEDKSFNMTNHSVAIKLRLSKVNPPSNETIFNVINNYITPGIITWQKNAIDSEGNSLQVHHSNTEYNDDIITSHYWFDLKGVTDTITIELYSSQESYVSSNYQTIANNLVEYLNSLDIGYTYSLSDLIDGCDYSDKNIIITNISMEGYDLTDNERPNIGSYFDFVKYNIALTNVEDSNKYIITISPTE
jgi:hypothetical protein